VYGTESTGFYYIKRPTVQVINGEFIRDNYKIILVINSKFHIHMSLLTTFLHTIYIIYLMYPGDKSISRSSAGNTI
jgi:hypothetical protein